MSVDWPLVTGTLGTIGALLIALAAVLVRRRTEDLYQGLIFTGAFLIFIGFLFQILPYIAKEQCLLIARWITIVLFLAGVVFAIVRYGCRRPKKSPPKSARNPEIEHTQANQTTPPEATQNSFIKSIRKFWYSIVGMLLIVIPIIVQLFIPPALWILILIAIGAIIIFIGSFIAETTELPDIKSKLTYLVVATVFFVALPISLYIFINPIINSDIKFSTDLGQGLLMASTVLLLLAVAGGGIITPHQKPIEKKMTDLIRLFQFVSLLFGFFAIVMILRWFILGGNELLANVILVFCYQMSSTLATSVAFMTSPKEQQESK